MCSFRTRGVYVLNLLQTRLTNLKVVEFTMCSFIYCVFEMSAVFSGGVGRSNTSISLNWLCDLMSWPQMFLSHTSSSRGDRRGGGRALRRRASADPQRARGEGPRGAPRARGPRWVSAFRVATRAPPAVPVWAVPLLVVPASLKAVSL